MPPNASVVLGNTGDAERPEQPNGFAPPPTAIVPSPAGRTHLVMPDPNVEALLSRIDLLADPVRAAQAILGELAMIWREVPAPPPQPNGAPTVRGVAMSLPPTLPPALWNELLPRIAGAPFLQPEHAQDFVDHVNSPPSMQSELLTPSIATFAPDYANSIRTLGHDVDAFASMLTSESPVPERLRRDLAYASAAQFVPNPIAGQAWFGPPSETTAHAFQSVQPTGNQSFTFTSSEGTIPLRMGDPGSTTPLAVSVWLQSPQFTFPDGDTKEVVLQRADQIVTFRAIAKAAGRNSIVVAVLAPSGRPIGEQTITVRSTAVNRIALLVTVGAASGLFLLYVRRRLRRRTSPS
jgi:hypothetical protein